ncbi:MAG: hypothetical protein AAF688_10660, partial [Bacteroidota bacterium]
MKIVKIINLKYYSYLFLLFLMKASFISSQESTAIEQIQALRERAKSKNLNFDERLKNIQNSISLAIEIENDSALLKSR